MHGQLISTLHCSRDLCELWTVALFASLKKQAETLFLLKKQAEKYGLLFEFEPWPRGCTHAHAFDPRRKKKRMPGMFARARQIF